LGEKGRGEGGRGGRGGEEKREERGERKKERSEEEGRRRDFLFRKFSASFSAIF